MVNHIPPAAISTCPLQQPIADSPASRIQGFFAGSHSVAFSILMLLCAGLNPACKNGDVQNANDTETGTESACPWDTDNEASMAAVLAAAAPVTGHICPQGDEDWYSFVIPAGQNLATIQLQLDAQVSPLDLMYTVWDETGKTVVATLDSTRSVIANSTISVTHYLLAGKYLLQVRDKGSDARDAYHPYILSVQTSQDPDPHEPNNEAALATPVTSSADGYISYDGDEDWFSIQGNENEIIQLHLTMPVATVSLSFRVENSSGETIMQGSNPTGTSTATDLRYDIAISSSETYYIVIFGADTFTSDAVTGYTLELTALVDPDGNESNNHPREATEMSALSCDQQWSEWSEQTGYIASSGDVDWYRLATDNCSRGIVEIELTFAAAATLPAGFSASVGLVREVSDAPCTLDQECQILPRACGDNLECEYLGNSCLAQGVCAGSGICLPSGYCAAKWAVVQGTESAPGVLQFSAPLRDWSPSGDVYFTVSDTLGQKYSASHSYSFRSRVMTDPDVHEASGAYSTRPPSDDNKVYSHLRNAVPVPVHDCTLSGPAPVDTEADTETVTMVDTGIATDTETDTASDEPTVDTGPARIPGCCGPNDWVEGYLSYYFDEDWYAYAHPCPNEDCMVRIVYDIGAGPVDTYIQVYAGDNAWFDNVTSVADSGNQVAASGAFGAKEGNGTCFYAYNGHSGEPFWYYLSIRDTVFVNEQQPLDGMWDWSPSQSYRFCVEKVAAGCQAPCKDYEGEGCGSPE